MPRTKEFRLTGRVIEDEGSFRGLITLSISGIQDIVMDSSRSFKTYGAAKKDTLKSINLVSKHMTEVFGARVISDHAVFEPGVQ